MTHSILRSFALLALLALALSSPAAAQSPSLEGYTGPGGQTQSRVDGQGPGASQGQDGGDPAGSAGDPAGSAGDASGASRSTEGGTLPFTGADIGRFLVTGLILLLFGFALRRLTAPARLN